MIEEPCTDNPADIEQDTHIPTCDGFGPGGDRCDGCVPVWAAALLEVDDVLANAIIVHAADDCSSTTLELMDGTPVEIHPSGTHDHNARRSAHLKGALAAALEQEKDLCSFVKQQAERIAELERGNRILLARYHTNLDENKDANRVITELEAENSRLIDDQVADHAAIAELEAENAAHEARKTELLQMVWSISQEAPDAGEALELRGQVAALIAEVGTLRATKRKHEDELRDSAEVLLLEVAAWLLDRADQTTQCCWVQLADRAAEVAQGEVQRAKDNGDLDEALMARIRRIRDTKKDES